MKVLNYGSLNIDFVYSMEHFVRSGETLSSQKMDIYPGGKGLNQSLALAKSGVETWHAGCVGEDGAFLVDLLKQNGVHTELITQISGRNGHAIIQRIPDGQNCILLYGGSNLLNTTEQIDKILSNFGEGDYLVLQNEVNEIAYIMEQAHRKKMKIVLNPSPMDEKIHSYPLEHVDYFILNELEAQEMINGTEYDEDMIDKIAERFPNSKIVLTLGENGSVYKDSECIIRQSIVKVPVVDTTAAGDTFTGFFLGGIVNGLTPKAAMNQAAKAAAIAVSRLGAAPSIPDIGEIDKLDRYRAAYTLFSKLQKAEGKSDKEGWINADDLEKELGISEA